MILCSGLVDYLLERNTGPGVTLGSSIYEYIAGTLWGGFEYPRSASSAFYQIVTSFLILVIISACKPTRSSGATRRTEAARTRALRPAECARTQTRPTWRPTSP